MISETLKVALIIQAISLTIGVIGIYIKMMMKMKELELRVANVEKEHPLVMRKLDEISNKLTDLRIEMQNKEDKE